MLSTQKLLILVAISGFSAIAAAQDLRELARDHAIRNPGAPYLRPAPPGEYWPKPIEEVASEATVVLQASLTRINSCLSSNEDAVLTDYSILGPTVIAGRLSLPSTQVPGKTAPLVLTVYGGQLVVEGVSIRITDYDFDAIKDGGQYLLF